MHKTLSIPDQIIKRRWLLIILAVDIIQIISLCLSAHIGDPAGAFLGVFALPAFIVCYPFAASSLHYHGHWFLNFLLVGIMVWLLMHTFLNSKFVIWLVTILGIHAVWFVYGLFWIAFAMSLPP